MRKQLICCHVTANYNHIKVIPGVIFGYWLRIAKNGTNNHPQKALFIFHYTQHDTDHLSKIITEFAKLKDRSYSELAALKTVMWKNIKIMRQYKQINKRNSTERVDKMRRSQSDIDAWQESLKSMKHDDKI